jgi:hypothetical protein
LISSISGLVDVVPVSSDDESGGEVMTIPLVPIRTKWERQRIDTPPKKSESMECVLELRLR